MIQICGIHFRAKIILVTEREHEVSIRSFNCLLGVCGNSIVNPVSDLVQSRIQPQKKSSVGVCAKVPEICA
jgi:hypothetical protein